MEKQLSFQQYRNIDLFLMAVLVTVCQALISISARVWFQMELYIVSPVAIITTLVMMRWGPWAGIHAALGGLVLTITSGGSWQHYLIYCVGNLLSMVCLLYFKTFGKERIRSSAFLAVIFAVSVQFAMLFGRAAMALVLGYRLAECWAFVTTDLLSVFFTAVIAWIARRVDGLFEDQKHYLLRMQETKEKQ